VSFVLTGPFPFEPKAVVASARDALSATTEALRRGRGDDLVEAPSTGSEPGLYLILESGPRVSSRGGDVAIAGFWMVFDGDYINYGPAGPPDRVPPFAKELFDAATEEVWWRNLAVNAGADRTWRPIVVLEWLPHFANRCALPPPGIPNEEEEASETFGDERETWLEAVEPGWRPAWAAPAAEVPSAWSGVDKDLDRYGHVAAQRSYVNVVRGTLRHDGVLHTGSFFMVPPDILEDGTSTVAPLDAWMSRVHGLSTEDVIDAGSEGPQVDGGADKPTPRHRLGRPLGLPGDRVGFHGSAWLTRGLGIWPARPTDVALGALSDRVVQQKWIAQSFLALMSSAMVLLFVLTFSGTVQALTTPVPEPMKPPPPPAAQPALSVCSADYQEFVEELRCQVAHLATRADDGGVTPICGDFGSKERWTDPGSDLQPSFCALFDRARDGWTADLGKGDRASFADFAAAQACFNVLGHPYPYRLRELKMSEGDSGRLVGNPVSFLQDEELVIQPLREMVTSIAKLCEDYGQRVEARVEGSVFATHVGGTMAAQPSSDAGPGALRRAMLGVASVGMTSDSQACFRKGVGEGLSGTQYEAICADAPDRLDGIAADNKMWRKLGGVAQGSVIEGYARSRYAASNTKKSELWACHLGLMSPEPLVLGSRVGRWEIPIPTPDDYNVSGSGASTQLTLDAALRGFSELGVDAGVCWKVVARRLSNYTPVHPLLGELKADGWPSEEQQLCGQVCATALHVKGSVNEAAWVTRDADLAQCVILEPGPLEDDGAGGLDRLRMPWNEVRRGEWIEPSVAQVCAFNVIAQDLMPPLEKGYVVQERSPKEYAGETFAGSRIAGGDFGLAARYVQGLAFGRLDAVNSAGACGHVATQCFTGLMMEVTVDPQIERYRWRDAWRRKVEELSQLKRADVAETYPWCVGIKDYLIPERQTAQFDTPCVEGVEEARLHAEEAFTMLEQAGAAAGEAGGG
jgi:hypothetical protein